MLNAVRFYWMATPGHRLRPWRSPYLRWRMETYSGVPAATLRFRDFTHLAWSERRQVGRFFRWMSSMERLAGGRKV